MAALALMGTWVLNVSRPGTHVEGCAEGCTTASPRREGPLRVMSLNVLHGFPRFAHLGEWLTRVAAVIREADADLVCLQEVPWHWQRGPPLGRRNGSEVPAVPGRCPCSQAFPPT